MTTYLPEYLRMRTSLCRLARPLLLTAALGLPFAANAQTPDGPEGTTPVTQTGPRAQQGGRYTLNGTYTIAQLIDFFASRFEQTILVDDPRTLQDTVQFIGRSQVSYGEAYQAMLAGLEVKGYSVYEVGGITHIVKNSDASQAPIRVGEGADIPFTASYVTQIISLDNVAVSDVQQVITSMSSADAKVVAYAPTNTLILTDSAYNLRKVYDVLQRLDVAAPKSELKIYPIAFASASEVAQIIEQIYGTEASGSQDSASAATSRRETAAERRRRRRRERQQEEAAAESATGVTAGKASAFISKVIADERTNSLIVLANETGHERILELIGDIDVDVDLTSRSQIHVVYLEHAKAEEIATVLSNLSSGDNQQQGAGTRASRTAATRGRAGADDAPESEEGSGGGVLAAFDSGMRITSDENTNSLVIIASNDDFRIVESVIRSLDVRRKQVFVDAVILEVGSDDGSSFNLAYHAPGIDPDGDGDGLGFVGVTPNSEFSSLGLTQDLLSGLALGVFGEAFEVSVPGLSDTALTIPAFGVALQALKTTSLVNIVSSPSLITLDNQEAEITVGRRVPFPTQAAGGLGGLGGLGGGLTGGLGIPVGFQREDVATTLTVTPRINSEDEVTLELTVEVSELEGDVEGTAASGGPVTSKREISTTALVGNNNTIVLGGLVGSTESETEAKVPILGDLPLIGGLFRTRGLTARRTNLIVFLTPHIIDSEEDLEEVMTIKMAQRAEFERRFYGKSQAEQEEELRELLQFSMNFPGDEPAYESRPSQERSTEPTMLTDEEAARYLIPGTQPQQGTNPRVVPGETLEDETARAIEEALAMPAEVPATSDESSEGGE